jgi:hypothetical protein
MLIGLVKSTLWLVGLAFIVISMVIFGIFGLLVVALVVGMYVHLRESVISPYELRSHPRLASELDELDDLAGALCGAPIAFSLFGGVCVIGYRCLYWLTTASAKTITAQTAWGWAESPEAVATGFLGFDKIQWWLVAIAPLELWLIVIFPALWFGSLTVPFAIAQKIWPTLSKS